MTYFCFQTDHRIIFTIIQILAKAFCKGNGKMIKNFSLNISGKNAVRNIHVLMYVFFLGSLAMFSDLVLSFLKLTPNDGQFPV